MSTLHTNDAASGITRLLDLGIEPFVLCSTLSGIISQRLIRILCHDCRESAALDSAQLASVGVSAPESGATKLWKAKGCKVCHSSGYKGRTGVFEVLTVDHHIRSLILKRTPSAQMRQSAMSKGMKTLWQSGWHKMNSGITSLDELVRILPPEMR
jgi:type II secretory ATPase GspE/PulE/Tfp pilus assembly ATPase PilB-like protein